VRSRDRSRDGRHVITAPTSELTAADLVRHMVGRSVSLFPRTTAHIGDVLLEVRGLTRVGAFRDISFSVRAGEIVGLAGSSARVAPRSARVLFGLDRADAGRLLDGKRVTFKTPSGALEPESHMFRRIGIWMVWSGLLDRAEREPCPSFAAVPALLHQRRRERAITEDFVERLRIRSTGVNEL